MYDDDDDDASILIRPPSPLPCETLESLLVQHHHGNIQPHIRDRTRTPSGMTIKEVTSAISEAFSPDFSSIHFADVEIEEHNASLYASLYDAYLDEGGFEICKQNSSKTEEDPILFLILRDMEEEAEKETHEMTTGTRSKTKKTVVKDLDTYEPKEQKDKDDNEEDGEKSDDNDEEDFTAFRSYISEGGGVGGVNSSPSTSLRRRLSHEDLKYAFEMSAFKGYVGSGANRVCSLASTDPDCDTMTERDGDSLRSWVPSMHTTSVAVVAPRLSLPELEEEEEGEMRVGLELEKREDFGVPSPVAEDCGWSSEGVLTPELASLYRDVVIAEYGPATLARRASLLQ